MAIEIYRARVDGRAPIEAAPVQPEDSRGVVANVMERLDVYAVLAAAHDLHPIVKRQHAQRIVEAVLALSGAAVNQ